MLNNLGPCPAQRDAIVIGITVHVVTTVGRYTDRKLGLADMPCTMQPDSVNIRWTVSGSMLSAGTLVAMVTFYLGLFQKKSSGGWGWTATVFCPQVGCLRAKCVRRVEEEINGRCPGGGCVDTALG